MDILARGSSQLEGALVSIAPAQVRIHPVIFVDAEPAEEAAAEYERLGRSETASNLRAQAAALGHLIEGAKAES